MFVQLPNCLSTVWQIFSKNFESEPSLHEYLGCIILSSKNKFHNIALLVWLWNSDI